MNKTKVTDISSTDEKRIEKRSILEIMQQIDFVKTTFAKKFSENLQLTKVPAPLFVTPASGLNDTLTGIEKAISFTTAGKIDCTIVHSLAKWKREALKRYEGDIDGVYTDMLAIRKDEDPETIKNSRIHSTLVDQWDWEKVIRKEDRNFEFLKSIVRKIYSAVLSTQKDFHSKYNFSTKNTLPEQITFISSQELEDLYPNMTPSEREYEYVKLKKAIFIMGIGHELKSGKPHDLRADDYDDWSLNGDIILQNGEIDREFEISSMGIRVDKDALIKQCKISGKKSKLDDYQFHKDIVEENIPFTIGGGIGQSRLTMFLLGKKHIAEVQSSVWPEETIKKMEEEKLFHL